MFWKALQNKQCKNGRKGLLFFCLFHFDYKYPPIAREMSHFQYFRGQFILLYIKKKQNKFTLDIQLSARMVSHLLEFAKKSRKFKRTLNLAYF